MSYEVLARKWRPRQFDDVVGQDHVTRTLKNALAANRVAHAYLFVGPRGIGKTSIARIFAKALNCAKGPTDRPCDQCSSCVEITAGTSLDVIEIDAASTRGIDDVRALRDGVKYMPSGRFKIYIIDEVHGLTGESFNALLKTLEEPPPHAKFFFATTEPHKIPATILSRCQRFELRRISLSDIIAHLEMIARAEAIEIERGALEAVARASEGGMRDAESALDQLIAFQGKTIKEGDVLAVFGLVSRSALVDLAGSLLRGDVPRVVQIVEDLDRNGKNMQQFLVELLEHFRDLLLTMYLKDSAVESEVAAENLPVLKEQGAGASPDRVLRITEILIETMDRMQYALSRKTMLETALIRCARAASVVGIDELIERVRLLKEQNAGVGAGAEPAAAPAREESARQAALPFAPPPAPAVSGPEPLHVGGHESDLEKLQAGWHDVLERVGRTVTLAKGHLVPARPVEVSADRVVVAFPPEFEENLKLVNQPRTHVALQHILGEVLKRKVTLELRISPDLTPVETTAPAPARAPVKTEKKSASRWAKDESVRKVMDGFGGTILEIKE